MTSDKYTTSVSGPGALITAVPALLGFIPERSLILVTFDGDGTEIGTTMRHDLTFGDDGVPTPAMLGVIDHLAAVCEAYEVARVVAVIVDDTYPIDSDEYRRLAAGIHRRLLATGGLHGGFAVSAITAGSVWQTVWDSRSGEYLEGGWSDDEWSDDEWSGAPVYSGSETGLVGDPLISPVAVARAVTKGRRVLATRGEMAEHLAPLPHCGDPDCDAHVVSAADDLAYRDLAADRARLTDTMAGEMGSVDQTFIDRQVLEHCVEVFGDERTPLDVVVDQMRRLQERQDLEYALSLVYRGATGVLTCDELRVLDKALRELYVRDALMALAVTDRWIEAEQVWAALCRRLRGRGQAAAATLLGFVHYVHGNGAMAGVAFDLALTASPGYSMAVLYNDALTRGIPPQVIGECAQTGYLVARTLGVELPAPVMNPAA
ncbi:UNVERIFIED_CONTAM: uncharacterized protein DUF4192 [Williamsia faeni]